MSVQIGDHLTQVRLVESGKLQDVDGAHGVVHHKLHGVVDGAINMRTSSQVKNEVNRSDIFSHLVIDSSAKISKDNLNSLTSVRILVLQHVVDPVEVAREVKTVQTDHIPVSTIQQSLVLLLLLESLCMYISS